MPAILYDKERRMIANPPTLAPQQYNQRETELGASQRAPAPPRSGDVRVRPARRQIYSVLAKRAHRAIMATHQSGVVRKRFTPNRVASPEGSMLPQKTRVNIRKRQPESYGVRRVLDPNRNHAVEESIRAEMGL